MNMFYKLLVAVALVFSTYMTIPAAPFGRISTPPLSERWFGIYVNNERVGFYRQQIETLGDGYRMEGNGSIQLKIMTFSKEASMHETYLVSKKLTLRSFDIDQTVNGLSSHVTGNVSNNMISMKREANGATTYKTLKFKGDVYPGPALNLYPLIQPVLAGRSFTIQAFDAEELNIKKVQITVLGEDKTADGLPALKLRNDLYPFVNNDIWVDRQGNTLEESVREGLVITKMEPPEAIGSYISSWALAKKDLIYDFSLVRVTPPIKDPKLLSGLSIEISDWNEALQLLQGGGQQMARTGPGRVTIKTGSLATEIPDSPPEELDDSYLKPADKIESDAPGIVNQVKVLAIGTKNCTELAKSLALWSAQWLKDTVDDGGGAVVSFKSKRGNCQTHARLYTALARAAGIPTRFVSGLVYVEEKGFLYHSWAESLLEGHWVSVDPTYNQLPADPTHLKLLEGHRPQDMAPIIAIIGRIKVTVLETDYRE